MAAALGPDWTVIVEGLNGRTTVIDDPVEESKNGKAYLLPCLESHKPIDLALIMLGTNDLKRKFGYGAFDIAEGVGFLVDRARAPVYGVGGRSPKVLVLVPPPIIEVRPYVEMFRGGREKSLKLKDEFKRMASERGVPLLFVEDYACVSEIDGIHLPPEGHASLGAAAARAIGNIFPKSD
jgi:lysophospholipase L1-like esterase